MSVKCIYKGKPVFSHFCSKTGCGYLSKLPHQDGSNLYPQPMFYVFSNYKKNIKKKLSTECF